jgi:hypothetical protein
VSILPTGLAPRRLTTLGVVALVVFGLLAVLAVAKLATDQEQEHRAETAHQVEAQREHTAHLVLVEAMQQCYVSTTAAHGEWPQDWPGMDASSAFENTGKQLGWLGPNGALAQLDGCVTGKVPGSSCTFAHQDVDGYGMGDPLAAGGCVRPDAEGDRVGWGYARLHS